MKLTHDQLISSQKIHRLLAVFIRACLSALHTNKVFVTPSHFCFAFHLFHAVIELWKYQDVYWSLFRDQAKTVENFSSTLFF